MDPGSFKKAIGRVKDQTTIGLVRVGSSTSLPDLEVAIVKATSHEEYPAEERHIREILTLTSGSQSCVASCVSILSGRLDKTRNWVVALKALILIQRLLQDGNPEYEQEIFFATRHGTRLLNMSEFRDMSRSNSLDYSAFVRTYALYLDEQLEYRMQGKRGKHSAYSQDRDEENEEEEKKQQENENENAHQHMFSRLQHLMQLLERFLSCRPIGLARNHRIVMVALYPIVKQSFQLYHDITEILGILIDQFMELEISECIKVYEIICRVRKQYEDLDHFYDSCKSIGLARTSEYPEVDTISQKRLDIMDEFIKQKSVTEQHRIEVPEAEDEKHEEAKEPEPEPEPEPEQEQEPKPEPEINASKALQGPEESKEEKQEEDKKEVKKTQEVGDLLNLGDDAPTEEERAQKMARALFDGGSATTAVAQMGNSGSNDWETALVESTSHLSNQQPSLPGGFDTLTLDEMYQQQATQTAMANSGMMATGSPRSVAFGSAGKPAMLALPASPSSNDRGYPFSPSLSVAPPPYVQMAEMEKKQRLLVEEQIKKRSARASRLS